MANINKCIILAGGVGSRLFEETKIKPKPLVEIGKQPIILHIINYIKNFKIKEFIICLGYKGNLIQSYFLKYAKLKKLKLLKNKILLLSLIRTLKI